MSKNKQGNNLKGADSAPPRSLKRAILLTAISSIIILLILFYFFRSEWQADSKMEATPSAISSEQTISHSDEAPDMKRLLGKWKRTDGDYTVEISSASADGLVDAGYFNPNPINVGRSEWVVDKGILYVMVELQDVNYPGSTYGLQYDPSSDKLLGMYYQAVDESTYNVEFVRQTE